MQKINLLQISGKQSIQYEADDTTLIIETKTHTSKSESKIELASLAHITANTNEVESKEQLWSQRQSSILLLAFIMSIFAPIFIAGSNNIKFLDYVAGLVFLAGILGFVYFMFMALTHKVKLKFFYFSNGGALKFYYRTPDEQVEVEQFVAALAKRMPKKED